MGITKKLMVGGAVTAAAVAGIAVPQSAGALVFHKAYSVVASDATITSRCALSVNTYNLITKKTNVGLQASTQPTVGATQSPFYTSVNCSLIDGSGNLVDATGSQAFGASTYANKSLAVGSGTYQICVLGTAQIQYGGNFYVSDCSDTFTI